MKVFNRLGTGWRILALLFVASILAPSGCATTRESEPQALEPGGTRFASDEARPESRLIVRTASLTVSVVSVPEATAAAVSLTEGLGGYVHRPETAKDAPARLELCIPSPKLMEAIDGLARLGEEQSRSIISRDVTEEVSDLEADITNKRALRDRLRDLLHRATNVKEVLSVEQELTRLQTQIDSLEARLERLREDVSLSTLTLELISKEPGKKTRIYGPLGYLLLGGKWFITKLFIIRE